MPENELSKKRKYIRHKVDEEEKLPSQIAEAVINSPENDTICDFLNSLSYEDTCDCLEYIFVLRVSMGMNGFLIDIRGFKAALPELWRQIENTSLLSAFRGRKPGFIHDWFTRTLYQKLHGQSTEIYGRFLTELNITPSYLLEIIHAKKHRIILAGKADANVMEWLNS